VKPAAVVPLLGLSLLTALAACGPKTPPGGAADSVVDGVVDAVAADDGRSFTILAINDTYRIEGDVEGQRGGLARVRALRRELEDDGESVLVLHAGDFLFPSFLSRTYKGAQMIDVLSRLDGDAGAFDERLIVTFGNHEFDKSRLKYAPMLDARVEESGFRWLSTGLTWTTDDAGEPLVKAENLVDEVLVDVGGVRVGVFSVTMPFVHPEYIADFADPIESARAATASLRAAGAEVVVALTHQDLGSDHHLVETLGAEGPDLVVGGHEHARHEDVVNGRSVSKADADAWSASVIRVSPEGKGSPAVDHSFVDLGGQSPAPDTDVQRIVDGWVSKQKETFCQDKLQVEAGCLDTRLARAGTELVAAELEIRRFETNLGSWVADLMLHAWQDQGAQVAFINSGALRINRNIAAGADITRLEVEELLPYPSATRLLKLDRSTLDQVLARSVSSWTGQGHFLQVAGMAFRHDPATGEVTDVTLLGPDGPRRLGPDESVLAVTVTYVADGGDGYEMLTSELHIGEPGPPVKGLLVEALGSLDELSPAMEGRICGPHTDGPCLALPAD
jgi:2',3'-cyclic-nucleotide 2'-phosphodiesterase (5'-nucleotidase family)